MKRKNNKIIEEGIKKLRREKCGVVVYIHH